MRTLKNKCLLLQKPEVVEIGGTSSLSARIRVSMSLCLLFLVALMPSGCGSLLPKAPSPDYYQIDYPFRPSICDKSFSGAVRVHQFSSAAPFDREQMIAVSTSLQVSFSPHYKWVSPAGDMIAVYLMRDLSFGKVFENVIPAGSPIAAEYGIGGQVYRFALEENGSTSHALLDLEISLWQEKPRVVIFRRHFHYESPPLNSAGPGEFASAMAGLVSQLSTDLRHELCELMQGNSHPVGG